MEQLDKLEQLLEDLAEEIEPHMHLIKSFLDTIKLTDKPVSLFSATSMFPRVESIRIGIFNLAKVEEYYSINILYRSLIEHFIKSQYLFLKTTEQKDDSIGITYYLSGQEKEKYDYVKSIVKTYEAHNIDISDHSDGIFKQFNIDLDAKKIKELKNNAKQFFFKNMVTYVATRMTKAGALELSLLNTVLPAYSHLSSSVHGGATSVFASSYAEENITGILGGSVYMSLLTRLCSYILARKYNSEYAVLYSITRRYMADFIQNYVKDENENKKV